MKLATNRFKHAILAQQQQIGLWCTLSSAFAIDVVGGAGFDWLLLDTEHSPGDVLTVLSQLQAISNYTASPVVRPATNDPVLLKRFLDIGVPTLLIPYVQSADEANAAVAALRYPPRGIRGVSALTRATHFGRVCNYPAKAEQELCLLVQIETVAGLDALEDIAAIDGIDGVFIGPGDLAASLGYIGQLDHPVVTRTVLDAIRRIRACGKPAGVLTGNARFARECMDAGTLFTAVGVDAGLLARGADALAEGFRDAS